MSQPRCPLTIASLLLCTIVSAVFGQELVFHEEVFPPDSAGFDLFLILGQSNAQGWQTVPEWIDSDYDTVPNFYRYYDSPDGTNVIRIVDGEFRVRTETGWWKAGIEPVGPAGVCAGRGCARVLVQNAPSQPVGIGLYAKGSTSISEWQKGGECYNESLRAAGELMAYGNLRGVLWHQGENDRNNSSPTWWQDQLKAFIADLRADLALPELFFVIGELGRFASNCENINNQIPQIVADVPLTAMVSSEGLVSTGDNLHFSSASQRIFGERYGEAFIPLLEAYPVASKANHSTRAPGALQISRVANGAYLFSTGSSTTPIALNVYTLRGTLVCALNSHGSVVWDCTSGSNEAIPAGSYITRVDYGRGESESRAVQVRR